jgi:hypothetical protein
MEASDREAVASGSGGGAGTAVLEPKEEAQAEHAEREEEHSRLPPLWASRPWAARIILATVPAAAFGGLCGWALGVNKALYLVLSIPLALLGGFLAGLEHRNGREAMLRGFVGGAVFGGAILIVHHLIGNAEKFHLKDPKWQLAIITAVVGSLMGRWGSGQRVQLEKEGPYIDFSRVSRAELIGMASGLVLFASLWLPWFATSSSNPHSRITTAGIGPGQTATAWQAFRVLDVLLVLAFLAPFILTWVIARGHALTWRPGEVTAIAGITAFILILANGIILGKPKPSIAISLDVGYFVGLLAAGGLIMAGYLRQSRYGDNKPPGVL